VMRQEPAVHICARHPAVWQEDPCDCPKCRMALEPATIPAGTDVPGVPKMHDMAARIAMSPRQWNFGKRSMPPMQEGTYSRTAGTFEREAGFLFVESSESLQ
jgi:hypothetical protein